jgi:hypothetical protein
MFQTFFKSSFPDAKPVESRAVSGVGNHFRKAIVLRALALRIAPTLAIDHQQLSERGYVSSSLRGLLAGKGRDANSTQCIVTQADSCNGSLFIRNRKWCNGRVGETKRKNDLV